MKQTNEEVIKQLNNLIVINNDRIQGYEKAIKETKDNDLKSVFSKLAAHSSTYKTELSSQVVSLGGEPAQGTKTTGKIFRAWMDVKAALTGKDREKIISSCITGEDAALETYDEVLNSDAPMSITLRSTISQQRAEILKDHKMIINLRDMVEANEV